MSDQLEDPHHSHDPHQAHDLARLTHDLKILERLKNDPQNVHLGLGYFLLLTLVGTAQQSRTKFESLCYLVVIMTGHNSKVFQHFMKMLFLKKKYCFI